MNYEDKKKEEEESHEVVSSFKAPFFFGLF